MARYIKSGSVTRVPEINSELEKIATAQTEFLSRSGETPNEMLADLDMNNSRITNLPPPSSPNEPVRSGDIDNILGSIQPDSALSAALATVGSTVLIGGEVAGVQAKLRYDPDKFSLVLDREQFDNGTTFDTGNSLVLAYRPNGTENANELTGVQSFRYLVGGYDNLIEGITLADPNGLNGLACGHIAAHHCQIRGQSNHTVCVGGSFNTIDAGWYSFVTGTQNTQLPRSDIGYSAYNFMGGILNTVQGNSNGIWGSTNTISDLVAGATCGGSGNTVNGSHSTAFGQSITINGTDSGAFGNGVQLGTGCLGYGRANAASTAEFSQIGGSENTNNSHYARTYGRGAVITGAHSYSDTCAHNIGADRSYTMTIPVKAQTTSVSGETLLESILGEPAIIASEPDSIAQFEVMLMGSTADKVNMYSVKVDAFARKIGAGAVEFLAVNVVDVYNTDPLEFAVTTQVGAASNMQFKVNQGTIVNDVFWTGSIKCVLRKITV